MVESLKTKFNEYLRTFGLITVNFASLEHTVSMFIALIIMRARGSTNDSDLQFQFELAQTITSELPFYKLLTMLESLYKHIETNPAFTSDLSTLINRAAQVANQRDTITHSVWFASIREQELIRVKTTARKEKQHPKNLKSVVERKSLDDLKKIADELYNVSEEITKFMAVHGFSFDKS